MQIRDKDRVVRRFIRTYDADGRIREENQIEENPALPSEVVSELNDKQLETFQGRVAEVRDRNSGFDELTTTSYNEHGDISEERKTATSNLAFPSGAFSIDEDGTIIPDRGEGVPDPPPPVPERTMLTIIEYRYEYDQNGNWIERTIVFR